MMTRLVNSRRSLFWCVIPLITLVLMGCSLGSFRERGAIAVTDAADASPAPTEAPPLGETGIVCRDVLPTETNPAVVGWTEPHFVCIPMETTAIQDRLFVFLPGTGGVPEYYTQVTQSAAEAGLHAVALRYPNDKSANIQICPWDKDDDCHEKLRREIVYGEDVSKNVTVDAENSIEGRLQALLVYLSQADPQAGWERYLTGAGEINWSSVVISGHSQGGGHAAFIAYHQRVERAVLFAWADVRRGDIASWLTDQPSQTPPEDYYLFWHEDDDKVTRHSSALMTALDLHQFGETVVVDGNAPPYQGSHSLVGVTPAPEGQLAHNMHVVDFAMVYDEQGEPIYKDTWQYLISGQVPVATLQNPSAVAVSIREGKAGRMGVSGRSYIDPELYAGENLMAYADEAGRIWLANLDDSGNFVSNSGRDVLIDEDISPLRISFNGPEFGVDRQGWALFYNKDVNEVIQVWRATVTGEGVQVTALTSDDAPRLSVQASRDASAPSVHLFYAHGGATRQQGDIGWLDEDAPQTSETILEKADVGTRWIENSRSFVFVRQSGAEAGQIAIYDTDKGTADTITAPGAGPFGDTYGWMAPEYGQMLVLGVVEHSRIEIYQDKGGEYWERIEVLDIPESSAYRYIGSPEVFTAGGKSYITLVVKQTTKYAPAEMWVWGISSGEDRFLLRCNDGQGEAVRSDPESLVGTDGVYVFYNLIQPVISGRQVFEVYRCETGLDT